MKKLQKKRRLFALISAVGIMLCMIVPSFAADITAAPNQLEDAIDEMEGVATAFMGTNGIWQQLINFVIANPICLVGLISFLLVLGVSMVRRLFTA